MGYRKDGALAFDPEREKEFSASKAPRMAACEASAGRVTEVISFMQENEISPVENDDATALGSDLHDLFALIPVCSEDIGGRGGNIPPIRKLREIAEAKGKTFTNDDLIVGRQMLVVREKMVDSFLEMHSKGGPIESFELTMDNKRLRHEFEVETDAGTTVLGASGLADFMLTVKDRKGEEHTLVLDYKTGRGDTASVNQDGTANKQITMLAALSHLDKNSSLASARGAIINREMAFGGKIVAVDYDAALLDSAVEQVGKWADAYDYSHYLGSNKDESKAEAAEEALNEITADNIGDHCRYCAGKLACSKFRVEVEQARDQLKEEGPEYIEEVKMWQLDMASSGAADEERAMELLEKGMEYVGKKALIEAYQDESAHLVRGLARNKPEEITSVDVSDGAARLGLADWISGPDSDFGEFLAALEPLMSGRSFEDAAEILGQVSLTKVGETIERQDSLSSAKARGIIKDAIEANSEAPLAIKANKNSIVRVKS